MKEFFQNIKDEFVSNFIDDSMWRWLVDGLKNTLIITFFSLIIGVAIGVLVAMIRSTFDKNREVYKRQGGFQYYFRWCLNAVANLYLTVIRGTPVVVQLLITYFIIFSSVKASAQSDIAIAVFAFGLNSGAYVAEIFRGGIMSIDNGQFEAGRSIGFNYWQTMIYIVIPQVIKAVLPTLCNEFIVLLKETSVAGYAGIMDLTKAGELIRGRTFSAFMPLIAVALIYLVVVVILTQLVKILERRLRRNER